MHNDILKIGTKVIIKAIKYSRSETPDMDRYLDQTGIIEEVNTSGIAYASVAVRFDSKNRIWFDIDEVEVVTEPVKFKPNSYDIPHGYQLTDGFGKIIGVYDKVNNQFAITDAETINEVIRGEVKSFGFKQKEKEGNPDAGI